MQGWYEGYWFRYDDVNDVLYIRIDTASEKTDGFAIQERQDGSLAVVRKKDGHTVGSTYVGWWAKFCPDHLTEGVVKPTETTIYHFICGAWRSILSTPTIADSSMVPS